MDAFDKLFWVVLFADKEQGIANDFDSEAKSFFFASCEAQEVAQCAAAGKHVSIFGRIVGSIQNSPHSRCNRILRVPCGIGIPIVGAAVFTKSLGDRRRRPPGRLTC